MNILLTNDDGYDSKGLAVLKDILKAYGTVYTFAPLTPQSGKGCGLTTFLGLTAHKIDEYNYRVEGTPVDCVMFAEIMLNKKIDLVVSGCNNGYNLSLDSMYSGTCGACFQALISRHPAIAFSSEKYDDPYQIRMSGKTVLDFIFSHHLLSEEYFLSVNLNDPSYAEPKGIRLTKLFVRHTQYSIKSHDAQRDFYEIDHFHHDIHDDDEYDVSAVANGFISITPLGITNFREDLYRKAKEQMDAYK